MSDYKQKWETLKRSFAALQATGGTKIPGYVNIENTLCYMKQLENEDTEQEGGAPNV